MTAVSDPLEPGYRVGVAPGFAVATDWPGRLAINGGTEPERGLRVAKPDWRPLTGEEMDAVTGASAGPGLALFRLSEGLLQRWWKTTESLGFAGDSDAYPAYAREVVEFLRSRDLPVPADAICEAVVTVPDQRTARGGLDFSADVRRGGGLVAGINLGDAPAFLVFANLPPAAMKAKTPSRDRWLAQTFLTELPGYPLLRLRLDPGDGFLLPATGAVLDYWTVGQKDVGIVLGLRAPA